MPDGDPRYIFDSVHGLISFEGDIGELLFALINTTEVQRLRRIHQLGMSPCVFPGANHSRFAHSIGMLHVTSRFIERFKRVAPPVTEDEERVLLVAALLHDVGHGPYSHVFEKAAKENHEKRTTQVVLSSETEVNHVLVGVDPALPVKVASLFGAAPPRDWALPLHLRQTISSQLDADRFDYLLRDSHYTGVDYGTFDSHWLLEHLYVDEYRGVYVSQKARDALETYVFARYHMYHAVYYHKATRAGEVMLRLLLETYTKALEAAETDEAKEAVVPGAPFEVLNAFSSEMSLDQYLQLDDYVMNVFFRRCASCDNPVLNELGAGLLNRRLWKCRDLTHLQPNRLAGLISAVRLWLRDEGEPDTLFQDDTPGDTPYKPYDPPGRPDEGEAMEKLIWLQKPDGELGELSGQLGTIDELTERYLLVRYYFPERLRDKLCDFMDDWLSKN